MSIRYLTIYIFALAALSAEARQPAFTVYLNDPWVNSHMERMTLQEKIGQLIMPEVYPDQSELHMGDIEKIIKRYKPGGLLIMKGTPSKTVRWINDFQRASEVPLLIAMDAENGPAFRMDKIGRAHV